LRAQNGQRSFPGLAKGLLYHQRSRDWDNLECVGADWKCRSGSDPSALESSQGDLHNLAVSQVCSTGLSKQCHSATLVPKVADISSKSRHEITKGVAYYLWEQRGRPFGSPEVDWYQAERLLAAQDEIVGSVLLLGGLDDVATEKQLTLGWAFVILPETSARRFVARAQRLLPLPSGRREFHAKELNPHNPAERQAYADFLRQVRREAETIAGALLAVTLNDRSWDNHLSGFAERIAQRVFTSIGILDSTVIIGAQKAVPALFTIQRVLQYYPQPALLRLEVDDDTEAARFAAQNVVVGSRTISAPELLASLADAYRNHQFPNAPRFDRPGITIIDSAASLLVQAADVLGNFSVNYLFSRHGPTTPGRAVKAQIFEDVFRDILPSTQFGQLCKLSNAELELQTQGALNFIVDHCTAAQVVFR
jgi:hypothetical protein